MNRRFSVYIILKGLPRCLIDFVFELTFLYGNQVDSVI